MHWAGLRGQLDSLRVLHDYNCNLHALAEGKANVLHFAVASGELEVVRWLVHCGLNKDQRDRSGKLPADIAKIKGFKDIQNFLKEKTPVTALHNVRT